MCFIKAVCYLANKFWWIPWSNFRFRHEERYNVYVEDVHHLTSHSAEKVRQLAEDLYSNFEYTPDGADQLWDAVLPPPYAYKQFVNNEKYKEDCDGFHSLLYQCLHASGIPCYLTVVWALGSGHCVLTCYFNNAWRVVDYRTVYRGYETLQEAIDNYNEEFVKKYGNCKSKVLYNCFLGYNYKKGKFYMANPVKEIERKKKENGQQTNN